MNPGPTVFLQNPELIYGVFITFFIANIALLPFGFAAIGLARYILRIPPAIVWPIVLLFAMIGAFAIDNSLFGIIIMLTIGVLAFIMEENRSEEHTSELQSLMRSSYAVLCLKKKKNSTDHNNRPTYAPSHSTFALQNNQY